MGFPVTKKAVAQTGTACQFSKSCKEVPKSRTRASQIRQIGNAMHVESIGSLLLVVILKLSRFIAAGRNHLSSSKRSAEDISSKAKRMKLSRPPESVEDSGLKQIS